MSFPLTHYYYRNFTLWKVKILIFVLALGFCGGFDQGYSRCLSVKYKNRQTHGPSASCQCQGTKEEFLFNSGSIPDDVKLYGESIYFPNCNRVRLMGEDLQEMRNKFKFNLQNVQNVTISDGFPFGKAEYIHISVPQEGKQTLKFTNIHFPPQVQLIIENIEELLFENCTFFSVGSVTISQVKTTRIVDTQVKDDVLKSAPLFTVKGGEVFMKSSHITVASPRTVFLADNLTHLVFSGNTFSDLLEKSIHIRSTNNVVIESNIFNEPMDVSVSTYAKQGGEFHISSNVFIGPANRVMRVNSHNELNALHIFDNSFFSFCDCTLFETSANARSVKTAQNICHPELLVYYNSKCMSANGMTQMSLQCNSECRSNNSVTSVPSNVPCVCEFPTWSFFLTILFTVIVTAMLIRVVTYFCFRQSINIGHKLGEIW